MARRARGPDPRSRAWRRRARSAARPAPRRRCGRAAGTRRASSARARRAPRTRTGARHRLRRRPRAARSPPDRTGAGSGRGAGRARPRMASTRPAAPLLSGSRGTSRRCGCRRPGRASGSVRCSAGTGGRRACRPTRLPAAASSAARISRAASPSTRSSSSSAHASSRSQGESCARQSDSAFQTFPIPATRRWSSRASPSSRPWCSRRRFATMPARSGGSARMSGPSRRVPRAVSSSTGPFQSTASRSAPRQHEPGLAVRLGAALDDLPAAAHAQVAAQDQAALEAQEQVLADRLDRLEPAAVEPLGRERRGCARVRRLDRDALADQHLQPSRRAVERVSLGHVAATLASR